MRSGWVVPAVLSGLVSAVLAGCVAVGPRSHAPQNQPAEITPTVMQYFIDRARDTNANGYWDTIPLTVYLFSPEEYNFPIATRGTFEFRLETREGKAITSWTIDEEKSKESLRRMGPGPGYLFQLNLLDHASDALGDDMYVIRGSFTPTGKKPVEAQASPVRLGHIPS